jgi:serine/threonine protein phosphatase 1
MPKENPIRRNYVIGDIHGCFAELSDLIVKICEDSWDTKSEVHLWFVGDLIDKGPNSEAVLESVFLNRWPRLTVHAILGNHEEKAIRWLNAEARGKVTGVQNQIKNLWDYASLADYKELMEEMPLWLSIPEHNILLVHGGIEPRMQELPPPTLMAANRHQKNILRTRYVSSDGRMIPLGEESLEKGDKWWADLYDGRFGTIIYGHQPHDDIHYHPHAIGIDTGCVYGNKLTALRLAEDGNHGVIQVKAKTKYARSYSEKEDEV